MTNKTNYLKYGEHDTYITYKFDMIKIKFVFNYI